MWAGTTALCAKIHQQMKDHHSTEIDTVQENHDAMVRTAGELRALSERLLKCPKCESGELTRRHHAGSALAPECHWHECDDCGFKTDPS